MAAAAILDFQKFKILTVDPVPSVERSWVYGDLTVFSSWVRWALTGTTQDDHLVVSIVTPNLVKIDAVVSIT